MILGVAVSPELNMLLRLERIDTWHSATMITTILDYDITYMYLDGELFIWAINVINQCNSADGIERSHSLNDIAPDVP